MYEYRAKILYAPDGDTADFFVQLGFDVSITIRVRFAHIDAPDIDSKDPEIAAAGAKSLARLHELVPDGSEVVLKTTKTKKGGDKKERWQRYLADVYTLDGKNVNQMLLDEGFAVFMKTQ
jgi:endonuclease YncB( thermonuclease family)